jgi:hypothetical protein
MWEEKPPWETVPSSYLAPYVSILETSVRCEHVTDRQANSLVGTVVLLIGLAVVAVQIGSDLCANTDTVADLDVLDLVTNLDGTTFERGQQCVHKASVEQQARASPHMTSCAFIAKMCDGGDEADVVFVQRTNDFVSDTKRERSFTPTASDSWLCQQSVV